MKQAKVASAVAVVCLLAVVASAEVIDVKLTAVQQDLRGEQVSTNVYKSTVTKLRITTKEILDLIASAYATNFPPGARLSVADGDAQVLNTNGAVLLDVSSSVFEAEGGDEVYSGIEKDVANGSYSEKGSSFGHFYLDCGDNDHFYANGLVSYLYAESFKTSVYKSSFNMTVAGEGYLGGTFSVLSGKISGKGSGVVVPETTSSVNNTIVDSGEFVLSPASPVNISGPGGYVDSSASLSGAILVGLEEPVVGHNLISSAERIDSSYFASLIQSLSERDPAAAAALLTRICEAQNRQAILLDPLP